MKGFYWDTMYISSSSIAKYWIGPFRSVGIKKEEDVHTCVCNYDDAFVSIVS